MSCGEVTIGWLSSAAGEFLRPDPGNRQRCRFLKVCRSLRSNQRSSWWRTAEKVGHLDGYLDDSFSRFLHTWGLLGDCRGRCLELGANPYFTSYLLENYTGLELTFSNFYGHNGETMETVVFNSPETSERIEVGRKSLMFNVEETRFRSRRTPLTSCSSAR